MDDTKRERLQNLHRELLLFEGKLNENEEVLNQLRDRYRKLDKEVIEDLDQGD